MAKQNDVLVGNRYRARVSGRFVTVRVTSVNKPTSGGRKTRFGLFNETTNRELGGRTAAFLRKQVSCVLRGNICVKCQKPTYRDGSTCKPCYEAYLASK